jgi:hypothetical protein
LSIIVVSNQSELNRPLTNYNSNVEAQSYRRKIWLNNKLEGADVEKVFILGYSGLGILMRPHGEDFFLFNSLILTVRGSSCIKIVLPESRKDFDKRKPS